jgi:hypothetical protein
MPDSSWTSQTTFDGPVAENVWSSVTAWMAVSSGAPTPHVAPAPTLEPMLGGVTERRSAPPARQSSLAAASPGLMTNAVPVHPSSAAGAPLGPWQA